MPSSTILAHKNVKPDTIETHVSTQPTPEVERSAVREDTPPPIVKLHPPAVHFAVALPILLLLLEIGYLLYRRPPDGLEMGAVLLSFLSVLTAYATGYVAHESMEDMPIGEKAASLLHTHERVGLTILLLLLAVLLLRVIYRYLRINILRYLYVLLAALAAALVLYQGSLGGALVYDFGVGVHP